MPWLSVVVDANNTDAMSLSISWTCTAPGWDRAEVVNRIGDLRRVALSLPFSTVDEVLAGVEEIGFCAHYLRGSESAAFRLRLTDGQWIGQGQSKTLYAGRPQHGGDENFLCAHLSIVALLDAAARMGFGLEVHDGGGFWHERDLRALVEVRRLDDRYVSKVAGQIAEAIQRQLGGEVELPESPSDQELDRWKQNEALAQVLDLVVRMRR